MENEVKITNKNNPIMDKTSFTNPLIKATTIDNTKTSEIISE